MTEFWIARSVMSPMSGGMSTPPKELKVFISPNAVPIRLGDTVSLMTENDGRKPLTKNPNMKNNKKNEMMV